MPPRLQTLEVSVRLGTTLALDGVSFSPHVYATHPFELATTCRCRPPLSVMTTLAFGAKPHA